MFSGKKMPVVFLAVLMVMISAAVSQAAPAKTLGERIGAAHAAGNYSFTSKPFLIEGAEAIRAMGSKVIKVFLDPKKYPYNSAWPNCPNLVDVISTQYFKELFSMDFDKYVLQAHWNTADKSDWIDGINAQEKAEIETNYYNAAKHLLSAYSGTNKTFFLEHWEADWFVNGTPPEFNRLKDRTESQKQIAYKGFLDYLAARHSGVEKAKKEIPNSGAKVFSAVEITCISKYPKIFRLIDHMDEVKADYVAYSMYECGASIPLLFDNIRVLKNKLNGRPFYIGETMIPEKEYAAYPNLHAPSMLAMLNAMLMEDAEFAILWEIFDNEPAGSRNSQTDEGFGLIRRGGSETPLYAALKRISSSTSIPENDFTTPNYFYNIGDVTSWVGIEKNGLIYETARGAVISNLKDDFPPEPGWVMHTSSVSTGTGDTVAYKGETITLWMPDNMPSVLLKYTKTVTKPLANPAGGKYREAQNVELSSATQEAAIYYSTDGSDPRTNGAGYTGKINVSVGTTLKAYAKLAGSTDSDVMTEKYELDDSNPGNASGGGGCNSGNFIFSALAVILARIYSRRR